MTARVWLLVVFALVVVFVVAIVVVVSMFVQSCDSLPVGAFASTAAVVSSCDATFESGVIRTVDPARSAFQLPPPAPLS